MALEFYIQAGNPGMTRECDPADESLSDALQAVFPSKTEHLIMVWNGIFIPLSYKYDISLMVDDIVALCSEMLTAERGSQRIAWPSNTFTVVWHVEWSGTNVGVNGLWNCIIGGTEALLARKAGISMSREEFLSEWKRPLEIVLKALREAGYTERQIRGFAGLVDVVSRLPQRSELYGNRS